MADVTRSDDAGLEPADRDRRRITIVVAATNFTLYALMAVGAWAAWGGLQEAVDHERSTIGVIADGLGILVINLAYGAAVLAGTLALGVVRRGWAARVLVSAAVAAAASVPRMAALVAVSSTPVSTSYVLGTGLLGFFSGVVGMLAALFAATLVERARTETRRREVEAGRARRAVEALQDEELRVRRLVFDQLHGTLQYHLVSVTAGLDRLTEQLDAEGARARAADLRGWAEVLEEIREQDVRSLSHAVFPSGADLGTEEAIQLLLQRLPPQVETSIELGPVYRRLAEGGATPMPSRRTTRRSGCSRRSSTTTGPARRGPTPRCTACPGTASASRTAAARSRSGRTPTAAAGSRSGSRSCSPGTAEHVPRIGRLARRGGSHGALGSCTPR